jgi:hypothetical protein
MTLLQLANPCEEENDLSGPVNAALLEPAA